MSVVINLTFRDCITSNASLESEGSGKLQRRRNLEDYGAVPSRSTSSESESFFTGRETVRAMRQVWSLLDKYEVFGPMYDDLI